MKRTIFAFVVLCAEIVLYPPRIEAPYMDAPLMLDNPSAHILNFWADIFRSSIAQRLEAGICAPTVEYAQNDTIHVQVTGAYDAEMTKVLPDTLEGFVNCKPKKLVGVVHTHRNNGAEFSPKDSRSLFRTKRPVSIILYGLVEGIPPAPDSLRYSWLFPDSTYGKRTVALPSRRLQNAYRAFAQAERK